MSKGPLFLIGDSFQTLWHETPEGHLVVDVDGTTCTFRRDGPDQSFRFDHDSLLDAEEGRGITEVRKDEKGNFLAFRTGPVCWEVIGHDLSGDVYLCKPTGRVKTQPGIWLPRSAHQRLHGKN
jgi:hypothetical protein